MVRWVQAIESRTRKTGARDESEPCCNHCLEFLKPAKWEDCRQPYMFERGARTKTAHGRAKTAIVKRLPRQPKPRSPA